MPREETIKRVMEKLGNAGSTQPRFSGLSYETRIRVLDLAAQIERNETLGEIRYHLENRGRGG